LFELCYGFWFDQGFRKIGRGGRWEFANNDFVRNQAGRVKNIHRREAVYSHSLQNAHGQGVAAPLVESEQQTFNAAIQNLKHDIEQMFLELERKEEERKMHEINLQYSMGHLKTLERKHKSVLSSVGQVLKKPGDEFGICPLTKTTKRKRRIPRNNPFCNAASIEDHVGTSHAIHKENDTSVSLLSLNIERLDLLESSTAIWEEIKNDVGASNFQSTPNIDFDDSMNDVEVQPKSLEVDMNSMPMVVFPDPIATEPDVVVIPNHVATEPDVIVVPNPVATEPAVINASDFVAVEPTVAVVPDFVEPKEQPVETYLVTTDYNNEFWGQYLQDESENEDIPSQVGQYWWTKRV